MLGYQIMLTLHDNDTFLVTCPAFPEVTTFGATDSEIERAAVSAIEEAIAARISYGEDLPLVAATGKPSRKSRFVKLPALTALKVQLAVVLRETGITRAELARRLGWHREQVDRLFRLDHASRLDQLDAAFAALGCELDIRVVDAAKRTGHAAGDHLEIARLRDTGRGAVRFHARTPAGPTPAAADRSEKPFQRRKAAPGPKQGKTAHMAPADRRQPKRKAKKGAP